MTVYVKKRTWRSTLRLLITRRKWSRQYIPDSGLNPFDSLPPMSLRRRKKAWRHGSQD